MASLPPAYSADGATGATVDRRDEMLPSYAPEGAGVHPSFKPSTGIDDKMPTHFRINGKISPVFVQPADLEAHLVLLGAFHRLREEVVTQKGAGDLSLTQDERWAIFLERAVYRFELWATKMINDNEQGDGVPGSRNLLPNQYPPLDVLMVWHTYNLNPRTYHEDCIRKLPGLLQIGSFPLQDMCSTIDQTTLLPHKPSTSQVEAFTSFTGASFPPPLTTTVEDLVIIYCPNCSQANHVPWINYNGTGYAQKSFVTECTRRECRMRFDRESLCVRKFYEDLERCALDPERYVLANTLVDPFTGLADIALSRQLTALVLGFDLGVSPKAPEVYGRLIGWSFANVESYCREGFLAKRNKPYIDTPRALSVILSAYRHSGPASMDLASAAMRQFSFINKMEQLGWTEPGRFESDNDTLTRCSVRYHHFLDLMGSTPGKYAVPTLDIDLAWHTHQILCLSYRKLPEFIDIVPDHDDKVAEGPLSTAYDETAAAWKERFGVPYSVCGCLPPLKAVNVATGGSLFSRKGKAKAEVFTNPRPDLTSTEDMHAAETHPSDHNAVVILNPSHAAQAAEKSRRKELEKRSQELAKAISKGKTDRWAETQQKRFSERHELSFLCPVNWGDQIHPERNGAGDSAKYSGRAIWGNFAVGECVKASGFGSQGMCAATFERPRDGLRSATALSMMERGSSGKYLRDIGIGAEIGMYGNMYNAAF